MNKTTVAAIQMQMYSGKNPDGTCAEDALVVAENIKRADRLVRQAAAEGAQIILLPELFERPYFCQERRYESYAFAVPTEEDAAVLHFKEVAKELSVVLPICFYERDGNVLYNSVAMIDADGTILGVYRKTHIPDDHYYQEKFYFTPGNTGFRVWDSRYGRIGVGICWDQWFPETARCLALDGADLILYPTAIGSEPILNCDSSGHWTRVMQGHAAANLTPVAAANRYGVETVSPSPENGGQSSELNFYGSSFLTDETGEILARAGKTGDAVLTASYDFDRIRREKLEWGLFRDRRPEQYQRIRQ